jgi:hypothetical protein
MRHLLGEKLRKTLSGTPGEGEEDAGIKIREVRI